MTKPTLNPVLKDFWLTKARNKVLFGGRGSSKCLGIGTPILMYDGRIKSVEDVVVGDVLMGPDGKARNVLHTTKGYSELFKVKQAFGMDYVVNDEHILSLKKTESAKNDKGETSKHGNFRRPKGRYPNYPDILNVNIKDFISSTDRFKANFKGYRASFDFESKNLPIPPYLLGLWLGDGCKYHLSITTMDATIADYIYDVAAKYGLSVSVNTKKDNKASTYRIYNKSKKPFELWQAFRRYHLVCEQYVDSNNRKHVSESKKHIPLDYLTCSRQDRLELLAGIIDTDGNYDEKKQCFSISSTHKTLAEDILKLASWLGYPALLNKINTQCIYKGVKKSGVAYTISLSGRLHEIPTLLARKQAKYRDITRNKEGCSSKLVIEPLGYGRYAGFSVDGDNLFCLMDGTVTHNSWDAAGFAVFLASNYKLRFLCARQFQNKIEESVYSLLKVQIERFGLISQFRILDNKIIHKTTGSEFLFYGLWRHIDEVKSLEGIDVCWLEEAHNITKNQWDILEPTIRKENSQFWIVFNPKIRTDFVYQRFVVSPPANTITRKINYNENPFLSKTMLDVIESAKKENYDDYEHFYLGVPLNDDDNVIIKRSWLEAAIDAHITLNFEALGQKRLGFDVADSGADKCANVLVHGSVVEWADEWKAGEDELMQSCQRAWHVAFNHTALIIYDSIGVGAMSGSKFNEINAVDGRSIGHLKFNSGSSVFNPDAKYASTTMTNKEMFCNIKAQAWWLLADRFRNTYNAVTKGYVFEPSEMISLSSDCPHLNKLIDELSTPKRDYGADGRVKVESKKDLAKREVPSPNLADALVMACTWLGASVEHWGTNQTRQGYNTEQEEQHAINDDIGYGVVSGGGDFGGW